MYMDVLFPTTTEKYYHKKKEERKQRFKSKMMMMISNSNKNQLLPLLLLSILAVQLLDTSSVVVSASSKKDKKEFDFFYFVQQWPGAYCDAKGRHCCYPTTGKPASDFGIHGLWPNYDDGSYPSSCDSTNPFDESQIEDIESTLTAEWPTLSCPSNDGTKFWTHEWNKHGTCAESHLGQREYFEAALNLKKKTNLLQNLKNAGIEPNDEFYNMEDMKQAIQQGTEFEPWIECNHDSEGNSQIYQVYICVDKSGKILIKCLVLPHGNCGSRIQFPKF